MAIERIRTMAFDELCDFYDVMLSNDLMMVARTYGSIEDSATLMYTYGDPAIVRTIMEGRLYSEGTGDIGKGGKVNGAVQDGKGKGVVQDADGKGVVQGGKGKDVVQDGTGKGGGKGKGGNDLRPRWRRTSLGQYDPAQDLRSRGDVGSGVRIEWAVPWSWGELHDDGDDAPNDENDDPNADDTQVMD